MLNKIILNKIIEICVKQLTKRFKLQRLKKYVEEDNELDVQVRKHAKKLDELLKDVSILKSDSHPPIFRRDDVKDILSRLKRLERKI